MADWSSIISKTLASTADALLKGSSGSSSSSNSKTPTVDFTKNMMGTVRQNVSANAPARAAPTYDPQEAINRWMSIFQNSMSKR